MRTITAAIITPVMLITGFRFSKDYRRAETGWKAFVYKAVDTVQANIWSNNAI